MPTYEYQCSACQHRFEQFQSIKDKALKTCPSCKKPKLERLIGTGGAIIFKGGGFYQTDYRSESYKKSAEADKAPSSSGDATKTSDTKSDAGATKTAEAPTKSESSSPKAASSAASTPTKKSGKKKAE